MSGDVLIVLLLALIVFLAFLVVYQQFAFTKGIRKELKQAGEKLEKILGTDSDEKLTVFTDHKELTELAAQINELLLDRQRMKAEYRRQKLASKKMLANISHDIKTPLTVILGYLEMMRLEQGKGAGAADATLEKVEAKAKQVSELISQFFTLAKLEAGDMKLEEERLEIGELCRENVLGFYDVLSQKGYEVELSIPDEKIFVRGDRNAVERILYNLLSNAIRYGGDGKYLGIDLRKEGGTVLIDVIDKGQGISGEAAEHVFDRLYTGEDSRNREIKGNGLGLTIARNLARQMGGDITLSSQPGVRTVFEVTLKFDETIQ
ncbi:MAG: HAMP domain-containing histidine kinase [Lachnospiraceae bacterium]|nr:HAMP domain-containing histidine kinase [Lachnospiraceae bacterium]